MNEGEEPQAMRLRRHHLSEVGEDEAVDNCLRAVGHPGEHRRVRLWTPSGEFDNPNDPRAPADPLQCDGRTDIRR